MEEAWELAVVSQYADWSGRHTRLRYQTVLSALLFVTIAGLEIKKASLPGFFEFTGNPPQKLILLGVFVFSLYSLASFLLQDSVERQLRHGVLSQSIPTIILTEKSLGQDGPVERLEAAIRNYILTFMRNAKSEDETHFWVEEQDVSSEKSKVEVEVSIIYSRLKRLSAATLSLESLFPNQKEVFETVSEHANNLNNLVSNLRLDATAGITGQSAKGFSKNDVFTIEKTRDHLDSRRKALLESIGPLSKLLKRRLQISILHSRALPTWVPTIVTVTFLLAGVIICAIKY